MRRLRLIPIVLALCCAAALGGCDACGDWAWSANQKSCHGEGAR